MQTTNYSYQQRTTTYTGGNQQSGSTTPAILVNAGLTDRDGARQVAKRILDTYDRDRMASLTVLKLSP